MTKALYHMKVIIESRGTYDTTLGGFKWSPSRGHFPVDIVVPGVNYADAEQRALSLLPTLGPNLRYDFNTTEVVLMNQEED